MENRDSAFNFSLEQLPSGWDIKELTSVADINKNSLKKESSLNEIEYIDISSVGTRVLETTTRYNISNAPSRAKRIINDGDTIISTVRPNRKSYLYIQNPKKNIIASTGFAVISPKKIDKNYLHYYLTSDGYINYLVANATGSAYPAVNSDIFKRSYIIVPKENYARKIGGFLKSIDDKIKLGNEMNKTLEEMAQAIFKSWFVDFEPFKDGELEESELGMIPKGWNVNTIDEIGILKNGKGLKKEFKTEDGNYNILGSNGVIGKTNEILFNNFVITIGRVGANYGEIHYELEPCWVSDNAITAQPIEQSNKWFLLNNLYKIDYSNFVGGSAQPLITQSSVKTCKIVIPDKEVLNKYFNIINPIYEKINKNNKNNECLKLIRDTLLPKLISGEINI